MSIGFQSIPRLFYFSRGDSHVSYIYIIRRFVLSNSKVPYCLFAVRLVTYLDHTHSTAVIHHGVGRLSLEDGGVWSPGPDHSAAAALAIAALRRYPRIGIGMGEDTLTCSPCGSVVCMVASFP